MPPYEHYNLEIARWAKEMQLGLVNPTPGLLAPADYTAEGDANFVSSQRILDSIWAKHRTDPKGLNGVVLLMHLGAGDRRKESSISAWANCWMNYREKGIDLSASTNFLGSDWLIVLAACTGLPRHRLG